MKRLLTLMLLALLPLAVFCEKVTVQLEKEGTLETVISEQAASDITELKIIGPITSSDIKFLKKCGGKIGNLESLDLSEVTLVESNEPYASMTLRYFYLTEEEKTWTTSGNMYAVTYYHHGSMNLSMVFEDLLLEKVILPATMKKIGYRCFANCKLLKEVVIPSGVTSIESEAFIGAKSLSTLDLGNIKEIGNNAFDGCSSLSEIDLDNVETIENNAFEGCTALSSVSLPQIEEVPEGAFAGCTGLKDVSFSTKLKTIGNSAFSGCTALGTLSLPEGLETIGQNAFENCIFESITIPNSVKAIDTGVFKNCANLESVVLPNSLEMIGNSAFDGCKLTSIYFPASLKSIGNNAFSGCELTSITFPASLKSIGSQLFTGNNLTTVVFTKGDGGLKIGEGAFSGLWSLKSVTFEEGLESIGESAFRGCGFTSVILPEGLKSIGEGGFGYCRDLSSVTMPSSLDFIGKDAFLETIWADNQVVGDDGIMYYGNVAMWCTDKSESGIAIKFKEGTRGVSSYFGQGTTITSVEFPSSMRYIGACAFRDQGITNLVLNDGLEIIEGCAFSGCNLLTNVVIPESVKNLDVHPYSGPFSHCDGLMQVTVNAKNLSEESSLGYLSNLTKLIFGSEVQVLPEEFVKTSSSIRVTFEERSPESSLHICKKSLPYSNMTSLKLPNCRISLAEEALKSVYFAFEIPGIITELGEESLASSGLYGSIKLSDDITSIPNSAFSGSSGITSVTIPNSVTSIGESAFAYCRGLTSVTIPDGVTSIGRYAFEDCSGLTSVSIPNSVTSLEDETFCRCSNLTSVTIPEGVTSIGKSTFAACSSLTSMTIPEGVTSIGKSAFSNCTGMSSVTIPQSVTSIGDDAFYDCSSITVVNISDIAKWCSYSFGGIRSSHLLFLNGEEIKDLVIPDGVTSIGSYAFSSCSGLTSVTIPDGVTSIGKSAFWNCKGMSSVTIPQSVTSIGDDAFRNCNGLKKVISFITEPMELYNYTFDIFSGSYRDSQAILYVPVGTRQLYLSTKGWDKFPIIREGNGILPDFAIAFTDINVEKICLKNWDANDDGYLSYEEATAVEEITNGSGFRDNKVIQSFDELKLFTGLKSIGSYAFSACSSLTSVTIPDCETSIGGYAFYDCRALISVDFGNSLTSIGYNAFMNCNALQSVNFGNSLTSIGGQAFKDCRALQSVVFGNSLTDIGVGAFDGTPWYENQPDGLVYSGHIAYKYKGSMPENTAIEIKDGTLVIANSAFSGYRNLISVTIPNSVTIIGKRAFKDCSGLTSLPIGNGVTSIGEEAFYCCYGISSVTIPNSVTTIGENAFYCCHMTTVIIPTSVTSIGDDAFCMCRNLTSVVSYIKEPFATNSFYIYYDATLYVPKGTYEKYKNTYSWNKYKTIKEIGDANSDGNVDEKDMIAIANHIMGETLEDFDEKAADMNGDQKIDVADIVELINQLAPKD